jgi:hypothetical protein
MTTSRILPWYQNPNKHLILAQFSNSPWTGSCVPRFGTRGSPLPREPNYRGEQSVRSRNIKIAPEERNSRLVTHSKIIVRWQSDE